MLDSMSLSDENIGFLVSSVLLWIPSAVLTVTETAYIACVSFKCFRASLCSISLHWWHKATYIVLFIVEVAILLLVVILCVLFGDLVGSPSS